MKTWRKYRTYTRVKRLWQEYKDVAQAELAHKDGRLVLISQKLTAFLEAFQSAYHEFKHEFSKTSSANSALNAFYGDCSELLLSLLELVDRHAMNLEAAEQARLDAADTIDSGDTASVVTTKVKSIVEQASELVGADVEHILFSVPDQVFKCGGVDYKAFADVREAFMGGKLDEATLKAALVDAVNNPKEVATKVKSIAERASESVDPHLLNKMRKETEKLTQSAEKLTSQAGAVLNSPEAAKETVSKLAGWMQQASDPEVAYHVAEAVNKALKVAELIITEEKYRGIATVDAPLVIMRLLSLLENVRSIEAKKLALRMIGCLSQSMESRLEICRLDGYRKVLRVLHDSPDHLGKEALTILSHLIEAHDSEAAAAATDAPPRLKKMLETATTRTKAHGLTVPDFNHSTIWSTAKALVAEVNKLLPSLSTPDRASAEDNSGDNDPKAEFPLSRNAIAARIEEMELEIQALHEMEPSPLELNLTPRAFADFLATEHMQGDGLDDDLMREIMGVQGALTTLTSKLSEAARDVKLDLMATISKLLRNNKRNQREFKQIEGYTFLREMLDSITDYQTPASQMFLSKIFGILQGIILDATPEKAVRNLDALELVLRLTCSDCHLEVRRRAVVCVQELVTMNALNVVCIRRVKGFQSLLQAILKLQLPKGMEGAVLYGRPEYRLMEEIRDVLSYCAVLLSRHDYDLVEDILSIGISQQPMHPSVRLQLLNCARDLLRDRNSRDLSAVSGALMEACVRSLRLALEYDEKKLEHPPKPKQSHPPPKTAHAHATPPPEQCVGFEAAAKVLDTHEEMAHARPATGRPAPPIGSCISSVNEGPWTTSVTLSTPPAGGACESAPLHWPATSPTAQAGATGGGGGVTLWRRGGLRGEQWGEEEETGNFVRFLRSSMGNKSSKDKAFIILLEALAHMVSLQLKQCEKEDTSPCLKPQKTEVGGSRKPSCPPSAACAAGAASGGKKKEVFDSFSFSLAKTISAHSAEKELDFETVHGFDMLKEAIVHDMCDSTSSTSFGLLLELAKLAADVSFYDLTRHIVHILDMPRMPVKRRLMCLNMLRSWLLDLEGGDKSDQLRQKLKANGCMLSLVKSIELGGPAIAREALLALATLVSSSEKLKASFENRIGFARLAQIVVESALCTPKPTYDLVVVEGFFQMASLGPVVHGIVSLNFRSPPKLAAWVLQCNAILNVRRPAPLYVANLMWPPVTETPSGVMSNAETYAKSESTHASRRSEGSRVAGSGHRRRPSDASADGHRRDASVSSRNSDKGRPKSVSSLSSDGVEQNLDDLDWNLYPNDRCDLTASLTDVGSSPAADALEFSRQSYILRTTDAAHVVLCAISHAEPKLQLEILKAVQQIVQADPENSHLLSGLQSNSAFSFFLEFLKMVEHSRRDMPDDVQKACLQTLAIIGRYHMTEEALSVLIKYATPPLPLASCPRCSTTDSSSSSPSTRGFTRGASSLLAPSPSARTCPHENDDDEHTLAFRNSVLDAICAICARTVPKNFFHCNGRPGWVRVAPVDKFPTPKVGYTLSCWVRISAFVGEEAAFVRWLQHDAEQILELYFQRLGAGDDSARCLSIRTHAGQPSGSYTQPFFLNVFSAQSFAADSQWHHVVFTHINRTPSLFLDGAFVQSCAFVEFPPHGAVSREKPLVGLFCGGHRAGDSGGFRGQISPILLSEGAWDSKTVAAEFKRGPLADLPADAHALSASQPSSPVRQGKAHAAAHEHKTLLLVSPASCIKGRMHVSKIDGINLFSLSEMAENLFDRFSKMKAAAGDLKIDLKVDHPKGDKEAKKDKKDDGKKGKEESEQQQGEMMGYIQSHCTMSLLESLGQIGGVALILRLLVPMREHSQLGALRVLAQVLAQADGDQCESELLGDFLRLNGHCFLLYVFSQADPPEEQVLYILLKMAAGTDAGGAAVGIKVPIFAVLVTYMLNLTSLPVRSVLRVIRSIDDHFFTGARGSAGREVWMRTDGLGLPALFNLFRTLDTSLFPCVINLLQQTAPSWAALEIEQLISFILVSEKTLSVKLRAEVLQLMIQLWTQRAVKIEHMCGTNGIEYVMCILKSASEEIRCAAIKLLGLMLEDARCLKAWVKLGGFEVLSLLLRQHAFTAQTPTTLLQLALGSFKLESAGGGRGNATFLLHPQAVQVLLELLPLSTNSDVPGTCLELLLKFLEKRPNDSVLLASGGLDWCRVYLHTRPHLHLNTHDPIEKKNIGEDKAVTSLHAIIGRLFVCGLYGDVKVLKVKELVDFEDLHIVVINQVLDHIEKNTHVPATSAASVLRTLAQLLEPLVEIAAVSIAHQHAFYLRIVRMINSIANNNSDLIRSSMKEASLLQLRDSLLIKCLRLPITRDGAKAIMQGFSFEWVAEKSTFREAHGLTHMLHMLFSFNDQEGFMLQKGIGCVIRNVFGPIADNRKAILRVLEDAEVAAVFAPGGVNPRRSIESNRSNDLGVHDEVDASEESGRAIEAFLDWFYEEEQRVRREAVEARIRAHIKTIELSVASTCKKAVTKRAKRLKSILEAEQKAKDKIDKLVSASVVAISKRLDAFHDSVKAQEEQFVGSIQFWLAKGEQTWKERIENVEPRVTPKSPTPDACSSGFLGGRVRLSSGSSGKHV